jgi:hypothetical protein
MIFAHKASFNRFLDSPAHTNALRSAKNNGPGSQK